MNERQWTTIDKSQWPERGDEVYRNLSYVKGECVRLAQQLAEMAEPKLTCEQCGNHVESLREVYSEDRSVGYSEGRWMCSDCRKEACR